ncbi:transposase [Bradyrhizobium sp. 180]|uniref:IS110 family transposase n=1 Tax=Bradyrhizobium sp. 180 TaxID=2782650 RepID=UPI001FF72EA3|nr:transposase [Bradyrhizobium sp. 180]
MGASRVTLPPYVERPAWQELFRGVAHRSPLGARDPTVWTRRKIIPPAYLKPYVRRGAKNDAADAAAICEAVTRANMRFVPIKSVENQGFLMLHRARDLLVRQRTMTACAIRAHFAEFGIVVGQGRQRVDGLVAVLEDDGLMIPANARMALTALVSQLQELDKQIEAIEQDALAELQRAHPMAKLLSSSPASARSRPQRSPRPCRTRPCSAPGESSRPGLA